MTHYARLTCVLVLDACALAAQTAPIVPNVETTGMIGLAETQTAQLNLLNPGVLAPAVGIVCTVGVSFVDSAGTVLKSSTLTILPGKSQSFSLHDTDIALATGQRREIRAVIATPLVPPPTATANQASTTSCNLIHTLEIYDSATGRTMVALGRAVSLQ